MSAGTGVVHFEFNPSKTDPVHFPQIWILPRRAGLPSGYEQKSFSAADKRGRLRLVASPDGTEGSVRIQQDARMYASLLAPGDAPLEYTIRAAHKGRLHVVTGSPRLNGRPLLAGDGVAIEGEERLSLSSDDGGEVLLFDLGS
jgi:redox-sensitive bicupin YhaK (pirin superfamily)